MLAGGPDDLGVEPCEELPENPPVGSNVEAGGPELFELLAKELAGGLVEFLLVSPLLEGCGSCLELLGNLAGSGVGLDFFLSDDEPTRELEFGLNLLEPGLKSCLAGDFLAAGSFLAEPNDEVGSKVDEGGFDLLLPLND